MSVAYSRLDDIPRALSQGGVTRGCLVLEGGALRGLYGVGVMDALMEAGINLQCTVGVSAGALNGISYVSGQIGRSAQGPLRFRHDKRYFGLQAFLRNASPFGFDFMFGDFTTKLVPLDLERFWRPEYRFLAVATNCITGKPEYFEKGVCKDIFLATRASATMPYISKSVIIDGIPYLDGGCSCKIPIEWALENNFERIVVVRTRHASIRRETSAKILPKVFYARYPNLAESLSSTNERYNAQCDLIEKQHKEGRIYAISPSQNMDINRMEKDIEKLGTWYWLGYDDAKRIMGSVKEYLS